jgi:hypothetical protein
LSISDLSCPLFDQELQSDGLKTTEKLDFFSVHDRKGLKEPVPPKDNLRLKTHPDRPPITKMAIPGCDSSPIHIEKVKKSKIRENNSEIFVWP